MWRLTTSSFFAVGRDPDIEVLKVVPAKASIASGNNKENNQQKLLGLSSSGKMKNYAVFYKKKSLYSSTSSNTATSNQNASVRDLSGIFKNPKTGPTSGAPQTKVSRRDSPTREDGQNIEILSQQKPSCSAKVQGNEGVLKKTPIEEKLKVNPTPRPEIPTQGGNAPINPQDIDEEEETDVLRDMCHLQPHEIPNYAAPLPKNVVVRTGPIPAKSPSIQTLSGMKFFYESSQRTISSKNLTEQDAKGTE